MTITEKILAQHSGRGKVIPGENVWVDVDVLMTNDVTGPGAISIFKQEFGGNAKVWDPAKLILIPDHYIFTSDERAKRNIVVLRTFAAEQSIQNFYDVGTSRYKGVCHIALAEEGFTRPGKSSLGQTRTLALPVPSVSSPPASAIPMPHSYWGLERSG